MVNVALTTPAPGAGASVNCISLPGSATNEVFEPVNGVFPFAPSEAGLAFEVHGWRWRFGWHGALWGK